MTSNLIFAKSSGCRIFFESVPILETIYIILYDICKLFKRI